MGNGVIKKQCKSCSFYPHCHLIRRLDCGYFLNNDGLSENPTKLELKDKYYSEHDDMLDVIEDDVEMISYEEVEKLVRQGLL